MKKIDYDQCTITDIRRGEESQNRGHLIYAFLRDKNNEIIISATLDYIQDALFERMDRVP